ncbi:hypothetical protein SAMN04488065_2076 [Haloplanus vescus]|uniref:Uncharacterized protein n=1 Tax=Haloplanus vescus TaxID=555874 RepID=A0A1H3Z288_9EURY|nr:hypothetical protein [Haloplanus vescus]SEA17444.1 hypothetical protein SAMN04488065_2076 [Haloplanus vescus]
MGEQRGRGVVLVTILVLLGTLAVTAFAPTAVAQSTVNITIDGSTVQDGNRVVVTDDPEVDIELDANESIETVAVRVGGETRRTFEPESSSFSERITLDLDDGEYEVSVVAESIGVQRTTTVIKDSDGPEVTYTSPFESVGYPSNGEVTLTRADTTLAAELSDQNNVSKVRIERKYEWLFAGKRDQVRQTYRIKNPGTNITQPILFGLGENELQVEVIDEYGQRTIHDITVSVVDSQRPSIDLDRFERSENGELTVAGTVSDGVKVNSLSYRLESTSQTVRILNPTTKEPTRDRVNTDFEFATETPTGATAIILVATDVAGNTRQWKIPFDYQGHLEPTITIDEAATHVSGDSLVFEGKVNDTRARKVVVKSTTADGETVRTITVHEGETADRIPFRGRIDAAAGQTRLIVEVTDIEGGVHRESMMFETNVASSPSAATEPVDSPGPPATTTPTATHTRTPTATLTATQPLTETPTDGDGESVGVVIGVAMVGLGGVAVAASALRRMGAISGFTSAIGGGGGWLFAGVKRLLGGAFRIGVRGGELIRAIAASLASALAGRVSGDAAQDEADWRERDESDTDVPSGASSMAEENETETKVLAGTSHQVTELSERPVAELKRTDVETLVTGLDAEDSETVVAAAKQLTEIAEEQPDLIAGTEATARLRDLRMAEDADVQAAAEQALRAFRDTDLY